MRALAVTAGSLFYLFLTVPVSATTCPAAALGISQTNERTQVAFNSNVPSYISDGITDGMAQWNDCNTNSWDWPFLTTGSGAAQEIVQIHYQAGEGPGCGFFDPATNTITLWDFYIDGSVGVDCTHSAAAVGDTVAHELGHYMGLAHTGCNDHIMGPIATDSTGRVTTSPMISAEEKQKADDLNTNDSEYFYEECGGLQGCGGQDDGNSPIVLDLDGRWFALSGLDNPVHFDIDGDWRTESVTWFETGSGDGLLFLDRYKTPWVDDGSELFGDSFASLLTGQSAEHGFVPLAELDLRSLGGNENGRVDRGDAFFDELGVWIDSDRDGVSTAEECHRLRDLGIQWLDLNVVESAASDRHGNRISYLSSAERTVDGVTRRIRTADVFLVVGGEVE